MIQHPAVFAAVRDAIFLADIDTGMIVDANPAAETLSGRTLAELQLLHHTQLHPPEVEKVAGSWFEKDSQVPVLTEGLILHKDGRLIPVEISSSHFSTPDGRRMLVGVFRDLTERKLAEAKLKETEDRFRVTFFQAAVGIAQTAIDGHWLLLNDRFCEILGYSREELAGKTFLDITYPDDREACLIAVRRLLLGETSSWSTEKRYIRNDGVIIWGKCFLSLVRDEHGAAQYFIAVVEDITQRIEAERALRQAEQRLTLAQSAANLGVWYRDWGTNVIVISGEYARLHGFPSDWTTVTREEWFSTIHPDDRERVDALRREARERTYTFNAEYRVIWPDGSVHWVMAKGAVFHDAGQPIGSTGVNMDITERKQAEAALQESQQRYKEVFDITSDCIFLLDVTPDARFKFAAFNPAEEKAVGFLSAEVSGKFIEEVVDEQLAHYVITNYRRCLKMGTHISFEEELVLPIGHRYFHTNLIPVRNAAGRIYRIVGIARDITSYRQTEEALRLSQQRLELAQEAAGIGSWDWDLGSNRKHCSKEYGRLYGRPVGHLALPQEEWLQSVHIEDRTRVQEELNRAVEGTGRYDTEFRVVWPDGTVHWLSGKGKVIHGSEEKAFRMLGVDMEISERKYADQALRESEERFRNMADTAPVMIWVTGPDKLFTFVNKTWLAFTGRTMEQELGSGWAAGVHPDDQQRCYEAFCTAFDARRSFQLECRLQRRDGQYRSILCSGVPRFGPVGIFAGYIGSSIDITDLQSEQRFRQLAENIDQVFWMFDIAKEQVLYVSPAFEKVWGCGSATLYSDHRWLLNTVHSQDRDRFMAFLAKATSQPAEESYRIVRPDGSVRWIQDRAFPINDPEGKPYRLAGIAEDVTAHRELEEQLRQAQKMEAVGRLAGGIAHDFNNLLTVIGGYSQMLLNSASATGPNRERLEQILNAANRAGTLTRQLLAFSRRQMWQPRVVSLNRLLTNMEALLIPLIGEHITIETEFAPEVSCVKVDPHQIEQVVMNLATNARDAMPHGGRFSIQTSMASVSAMGANNSASGFAKRVRIRISDTGCGMDDRTRERAFEPFFTTKGLGKGTGLGLSTVYGIVRQNQGEIHISSELGRGTVFDLYFPSVLEREAESELQATQLPKAAATETILVAEDEPGVRGLVKQTLEQLGYRVLEATDGYEALRLVEQHTSQIHLLLTDVIMPLMNGQELATRLRSVRAGIKVLYMSGYADEVLAFHGIDRPEIAFIQKPFTASELAAKVDKLLSADRAKVP